MAIAFDASSTGGDTTGTSLTWAHTCTGDNLILFVLTRGGGGEGDRISGITYDSVALTKISHAIVPGDSPYVSLWYLIAPSTGADNIVISLSSGYMVGLGCSYSGAKQSSQPDNSTTKTQAAGSSSITTTLTTVADNCWTIISCRGGGTLSGGAGTTFRVAHGGDNALLDSNAAITPAASTSLIVDSTSTPNFGTVMASFAPVVSEVVKDIIGAGLIPFARA